ncbi:exodeoxyribonuclease V subunit alpha [Candidatus Methylospira mobilis]|uniref:RecBCD enzyme subunit RecD n=1 Tax=Candidatus Methylospira mobilis TaxID=1808979 RepID=A0A5Q0BJW9_9GAMM|nr:exodeoxyribonuclease V subunit alpha [Candidatus Methylospira mobilis]QFY43422.1 exodeoxyribonuclease V subunit alpha [Candidatus Methylospira mobilis]
MHISAESVLHFVDESLKSGELSRLDRAFMLFLRNIDTNASPLVWLAGAWASRQVSRGHVCLNLEAWANNGLEESALQSCTLDQWLDALRHSLLVGAGAGNTPLVLDGRNLYLRRYWQYEQSVAAAVKQRAAQPALKLPGDLRARLNRLFYDGTQKPDWQKIACAVALRARFSIITGGPGTGKTSTVTRLLALLVDIAGNSENGGRKPIIRLAAPTGKAAARVTESIRRELEKMPLAGSMRSSLPGEAATLHRLLGSRPGSRLYAYNRNNPLPADIVVVDEASMIDLEMMAALLDALAEKTQLILLGDKDQLASVEAGFVMGNLCRGVGENVYHQDTLEWIARQSGEIIDAAAALDANPLHQQIVMLRHSHRFDGDSGIGRLAQAVNAGDDTGAIWQAHTDIEQMQFQNAHDVRLRMLVGGADAEGSKPGYAYYLATLRATRPQDQAGRQAYDAWAGSVLDSFGRFQLLCALRAGPWGGDALNRSVKQWLFPEHAQGDWYEGRPVMVMRNDYSLDLMNGDIGIALQDGRGRLAVVFRQPDGHIRWISPGRLSDVETAFAITVHKSQGSEFDHVVLVIPGSNSALLTRELIYTGITRAKKRFTLLYGDEAVFRRALQTRALRCGGLETLLAHHDNG